MFGNLGHDSVLRCAGPARARASAPTIGEHFQQHGMHTARVGKVFHMGVPHAQLDGSNGKDVAAWLEKPAIDVKLTN